MPRMRGQSCIQVAKGSTQYSRTSTLIAPFVRSAETPYGGEDVRIVSMRSLSNSCNGKSVLAHALAGALSLAALGCGGGDSSPSGEGAGAAEDGRTQLCGLLSSGDIMDVLRKGTSDPMPGQEGVGHCTWPAFDGSGTVVELVLESGGGNPPPDADHPIVGLGDQAIYRADDDMVRVFFDDQVLNVSAPGADEAQLTDLASRALASLRW